MKVMKMKMVPSSEKHDATLSATSMPLSSIGEKGMLMIVRLVIFPQDPTGATKTLPTPRDYMSSRDISSLTTARKGKGGATNLFMHRSSEQGRTRMSEFGCSSWDA